MKYTQGMNMEQFEHIEQVSCYNNNYYKGLGICDILFGESDDDDTTKWWLINGFKTKFLGISCISGGEKLMIMKERQT